MLPNWGSAAGGDTGRGAVGGAAIRQNKNGARPPGCQTFTLYKAPTAMMMMMMVMMMRMMIMMNMYIFIYFKLSPPP